MTDHRANAMARIEAAKAARESAGLHVHWTLPNGEHWSAYADCEATKARWIEAKAKLGWQVAK